MLAELSCQARGAAEALAAGGAAACAGTAAGLWLPRAFIRRRLLASRTTEPGEPGTAAAAAPPAPGVDFAFASSLTGLLLLVLALLWAVLIAASSSLESFRAALTQHFVLPPAATRLLLLAPAAVGILLAGAAGATVLAALHGWLRLISPPRTTAARLWIAMLVAGLPAAALPALTGRSAALNAAALLPLFAAGMLAVWRSPGRGAPAAAPPARPHQPAALWRHLGAPGVLAAAAGAGLTTAVPDGPLEPAATGGIAAASLCGALAGLLAAHLGRRRWPRSSRAGPWLLLAASLVWMLAAAAGPGASPTGRLTRAAVLIALASAGVTFAGRELGRALGRVQPVLAALGGAAAGGGGIGLALAGLVGDGDRALAAALLTAAAAGLASWADARNPRGLRLGGTVVAGAWLVAALLLGPERQRPPGTRGRTGADAPPGPPTAVLRHALSGRRGVVVWPGGREGDDAWHVDLGGPRYEAVILATPDDRARVLRTEQARRLLRRCARALRAGGRLFIAPPAGPLRSAALRLRPHGGLRGDCEVVEVELRGPGGAARALALGRDAAAWLAALPLPEGFRVQFWPAATAGRPPGPGARPPASAERPP